MVIYHYSLQEALAINTARWARVFFAVEDLIVARSGLYYIRRKQLRDAVKLLLVLFYLEWNCI